MAGGGGIFCDVESMFQRSLGTPRDGWGSFGKPLNVRGFQRTFGISEDVGISSYKIESRTMRELHLSANIKMMFAKVQHTAHRYAKDYS